MLRLHGASHQPASSCSSRLIGCHLAQLVRLSGGLHEAGLEWIDSRGLGIRTSPPRPLWWSKSGDYDVNGLWLQERKLNCERRERWWAWDYGTVKWEIRDGSLSVPFSWSEKNTTGYHSVDLGCKNPQKVDLSLSKCAGCGLGDKKISVFTGNPVLPALWSIRWWVQRSAAASLVSVTRDFCRATHDDMEEIIYLVRKTDIRSFMTLTNEITHFLLTFCFPFLFFLFVFKPTPAEAAPAATTEKGLTKPNKMKVKWSQLGLVFFLVLSLVMTGCFFWQYQLPKLPPGENDWWHQGQGERVDCKVKTLFEASIDVEAAFKFCCCFLKLYVPDTWYFASFPEGFIAACVKSLDSF